MTRLAPALLALPLAVALASSQDAATRLEAIPAEVQALNPEKILKRRASIKAEYLQAVTARGAYAKDAAFGRLYENEMRSRERIFYALLRFAQEDVRSHPQAAQRDLDHAAEISAGLQQTFAQFLREKQEERANRAPKRPLNFRPQQPQE
ncbi:MAG: hypothetical protein HY552_03405 [Elusimicrobia bacterium]|nr:hypothetical protein [Elusimicrobiota bacterium]